MAKKKTAVQTKRELATKTPGLSLAQVEPGDLLSTGSTLLNLALSGNAKGGLAKGRYFLLIGESEAGKTFFVMTIYAEAAHNSQFDGYRFIYDGAEGGALMDLEKFFGSVTAERIEPPGRDADKYPLTSQRIEDLYYFLDDALKEAEKNNRPFIYCIDSIDALTSDQEQKKFQENKTASRSGKGPKGDYGDGKAKVNSRYIRGIQQRLLKTGSILLIVNQERDKIDANMFESKKTHSGGRSLKFYACAQIWLNLAGKLTKTVRGKPRKIGIRSKVHVCKNRLTGKDRTVRVPISYSYGIDDVGSLIDFLCEEKHWKTNDSGVIDATEDFDVKVQRQKLIERVESEGLEPELRMIATQVWNEIEAECKLPRKPRY